MAKRRAEDSLLHDSRSKRCSRSMNGVDMQLSSVASSGGVSPPSLLALLGSRFRKRPQYFDDPDDHEDAALNSKHIHCDMKRHAANLRVQTPGSFQERQRRSSVKRAREECTRPGTASTKLDDSTDEKNNAEDCTYNSFQYWRVPYPNLTFHSWRITAIITKHRTLPKSKTLPLI